MKFNYNKIFFPAFIMLFTNRLINFSPSLALSTQTFPHSRFKPNFPFNCQLCEYLEQFKPIQFSECNPELMRNALINFRTRYNRIGNTTTMEKLFVQKFSIFFPRYHRTMTAAPMARAPN